MGNVPPGEQANSGGEDAAPANGIDPTDTVTHSAKESIEEDVAGEDAHGHQQPARLAPAEVIGDNDGHNNEHAELGSGVYEADQEALHNLAIGEKQTNAGGKNF